MKHIDGQMSLFTWQDEQRGYHYCKDCKHAKYKETSRIGTIWFCGKHHSFINEHTIDTSITKDNCFERRTG